MLDESKTQERSSQRRNESPVIISDEKMHQLHERSIKNNSQDTFLSLLCQEAKLEELDDEARKAVLQQG